MTVLAIHSGWQLGGSTLNAGFVVRTLTRRSHVVYALNRYADDEGSRHLERCGARLFYFPPFTLKMNTTAILEQLRVPAARELMTSLQDAVKAVVGFWLMCGYLRRYRPDVVYLTDSGLLQCLLAAKAFRVPVICEIQAELIRGRWGVRRALCVALLRRADAVFGITPTHIAPLVADGPRANVSVIPNTTDDVLPASPAEDLRRRYAIPEAAKVVAYFGGASPIKGYRCYLHLMRAMAASRSDVVFLFAGPIHTSAESAWGRGTSHEGAAETDEVVAFVRAHGLSDRVRILGEVTNVMDMLRQADCVVVPNAFPHFSRTVLESFACGVPVVASDDRFNRDVITDGVNGTLVALDNGDAWVRAVTAVLDHPEAARRQTAEGRRSFEAAFRPEAVAAQILTMFEGVARSSARGRGDAPGEAGTS